MHILRLQDMIILSIVANSFFIWREPVTVQSAVPLQWCSLRCRLEGCLQCHYGCAHCVAGWRDVCSAITVVLTALQAGGMSAVPLRLCSLRCRLEGCLQCHYSGAHCVTGRRDVCSAITVVLTALQAGGMFAVPLRLCSLRLQTGGLSAGHDAV